MYSYNYRLFYIVFTENPLNFVHVENAAERRQTNKKLKKRFSNYFICLDKLDDYIS